VGGRPNWLALAWSYRAHAVVLAMDLVNENKSVMGFNLSYMFHREDLLGAAMGRILGGFASGALRMPAVTTYPLKEVAQAHADLESGRRSASWCSCPEVPCVVTDLGGRRVASRA
jgi:NADPH:quinone reductase-like Zn-dependent oxidoreductase